MVAVRRARLLAAVVAAVLSGAIGIAPSEARTTSPAYAAHCGLPDLSTGARTCSYTFTHSHNIETFVVPPTTRSVLQITAVGAPGFGEDALRSHGARVTGSFDVLSGTPLFVVVGGDGFYDGYNGGVDGGGGASDVRVGVPDLNHRVIIAELVLAAPRFDGFGEVRSEIVIRFRHWRAEVDVCRAGAGS